MSSAAKRRAAGVDRRGRREGYVPIADYGLISDMHSCALVARDGSIDWCCFPRFDSPSIFGRLLDAARGGYFQIAPRGSFEVSRRYLPNTNVLETTFRTDEGEGVLIDFMPVQAQSDPHEPHRVVCRQQIDRIFRCTRGELTVDLDCEPRFDYADVTPFVHLSDAHHGFAHGGPQGLTIYCSAPLEIVAAGFHAESRLREGDELGAAAGYVSRSDTPEALTAEQLRQRLDDTVAYWERWAEGCNYEGARRDDVLRSALVVKALSYAPSGALVAAATTSLPEELGGSRNWDYRYTWIRDATLALIALFPLGLHREAEYFKSWLEWTTAGRANELQVAYGIEGERRLPELDMSHLEGYAQSRPVRVGNLAHGQFQLDIYGELLDSAHMYRSFGGEMDPDYWEFLREVAEFVIAHWREPDCGIWELRTERRHFVHSKVMCWVALRRAISTAEALDLPADRERWRRVAREIRDEVLQRGFSRARGTFVQSYASQALDANLLMLPLVGFVRADDPRMRATIEAIEQELTAPDGLVYRYTPGTDGLPGGEGTFVVCSYWLVSNLYLLGEEERATELFDRVCARRNDLGLISEQIDPRTGDLAGNFPQVLSHLGLITAALRLDGDGGGAGSSSDSLSPLGWWRMQTTYQPGTEAR